MLLFSLLLGSMSVFYFRKANAWAEIAEFHPSNVLWHGLEIIDSNEMFSGSYVIATTLFNGALSYALSSGFAFILLAMTSHRILERRRLIRILEVLRSSKLIEQIDDDNSEKPPGADRTR